MLLSIIIPIYNTKEKIVNLIESLNNIDDKYKNFFEIIFVSDGSLGNEKRIIKKEMNKKYIFLEKENSGPSKSREYGLKHSKGDYIWFIDSDDAIDYTFFGKILNILKKNNLDVLAFNFCEYYINDMKPINIKLFRTNYFCINNFQQRKIYSYSQWSFRSCSLVNKIFSKEIIVKNNFDFISSKYHEDTVLWLELLSKINNYLFIGDNIYIYCKYNDDKSSMDDLTKDVNLNMKNMLNAIKIVYEYYDKNNLYASCNFKEIKKIICHYIISDLTTTKINDTKIFKKYKQEYNKLNKDYPKFKINMPIIKIIYYKNYLLSKFKKLLNISWNN